MIGNQCPVCRVIGVGVYVEKIGEYVPCACLPKGKTCADCKFQSECSAEGLSSESNVFCKAFGTRAFAEEGKLTFWEKYDRHLNEKEEVKQEEKQKRALLQQNALVWTEELIIESNIPHQFRKIYMGEPPKPKMITLLDTDVPDFLKEILAFWHELARTEPYKWSQYRNSRYEFIYDGVYYAMPAPLQNDGTPLSYVWQHLRIDGMFFDQGIKAKWRPGDYVPFENQRQGNYEPIWEIQYQYRAKTPQEAARRHLDSWNKGWRKQIGEPLPKGLQKILESQEMKVKIDASA